jgi:hypothetical protein
LGFKDIILNLRSEAPFTEKGWMGQPMLIREYGSVANTGDDDSSYSYRQVVLRKEYDGLVLINTSSRATPTKTGMRIEK